jgi:DNA-binding GntR family transcriptional regulator
VQTGTPGRQLAQARLREAILRGDLGPGHRIVETDVVESLGVTRGGVRLAIDGLAAEGLVERVPHRGARVRTVTTAEAVEITECRMALEGLVAAKAAELATDEELVALRAHVELMREAVAAGEHLRYSGLIEQLHRLVRRAARQPTADALLERLGAQVVRHQFQLSLRPGRPRISLTELAAVVDAIAARRPAAAEDAARAHFRSVVTALAETIPDPDPRDGRTNHP